MRCVSIHFRGLEPGIFPVSVGYVDDAPGAGLLSGGCSSCSGSSRIARTRLIDFIWNFALLFYHADGTADVPSPLPNFLKFKFKDLELQPFSTLTLTTQRPLWPFIRPFIPSCPYVSFTNCTRCSTANSSNNSSRVSNRCLDCSMAIPTYFLLLLSLSLNLPPPPPLDDDFIIIIFTSTTNPCHSNRLLPLPFPSIEINITTAISQGNNNISRSCSRSEIISRCAKTKNTQTKKPVQSLPPDPNTLFIFEVAWDEHTHTIV